MKTEHKRDALLNLELQQVAERLDLVCQPLRHVITARQLQQVGQVLRKRLVAVDVMTHGPGRHVRSVVLLFLLQQTRVWVERARAGVGDVRLLLLRAT